MAIARIAYPCLAPLSIHGSSKRFRELVTYRERTPISSVSRVRKSYVYCLDHPNQQAIFVETPPTVDLLQASFYFLTQYEQAQRLIAVPYTTLRELVSEL